MLQVARVKHRLDVLVVERGLAASRERARALILAGQVEVDGRVETKAGTAVDVEATVTLWLAMSDGTLWVYDLFNFAFIGTVDALASTVSTAARSTLKLTTVGPLKAIWPD